MPVGLTVDALYVYADPTEGYGPNVARAIELAYAVGAKRLYIGGQ